MVALDSLASNWNKVVVRPLAGLSLKAPTGGVFTISSFLHRENPAMARVASKKYPVWANFIVYLVN
jgi:hypothetical protein